MPVILRRLTTAFLITVLLITGCNLPAGLRPAGTPTRVREPLPAGLVETDPPDGSQIGLTQPLTFYFNQAMDRASVETALNLQPPGTLTWVDDATLTFTPSQPYPPASEFSVYIDASARAKNGLALTGPVSLTYLTADYLRPVQVLPEDNSEDVSVTAAIVAIFNQPVVPLGADPATLPAAFTLLPGVSGHGEWLNTSTCIFYPDTPMAGGTRYTIRINPGLTSTAGSPLAPEAKSQNWKFYTALPRLVAISPLPGDPLDIDPVFTLTFNQPMDAARVTGSLVLSGPGGIVDGKTSWNADGTELTFDPSAQLERGQAYSLVLGTDAAGRNGTPIDQGASYTFTTFEPLRVVSARINYSNIVLTFSAPIQDLDLETLITMQPTQKYSTHWLDDDGLSLTIYGDFEFETTYTITVSPDLTDRWGVRMGAPYSAQVTTAAAESYLMVFSGSTQVTRPADPTMTLVATNIRTVNLALSPIALNEYLNLSGPESYLALQSFTPSGTQRATQTFNLPRSRGQEIKLDLPARGGRLAPGLYHLAISSPQVVNRYYDDTDILVVSSDVNVTFKIGPTEVLVWAVDLRDGTPLPDAPVSIYAYNGTLLASGQTDSQGIWRGPVPEHQEYIEAPYYAVTGQPGQDNFGLGNSIWDMDLSPYNFGYSGWQRGHYVKTYLYSDRPIYRPDQTVYYRGVIRDAFDASYSLPALDSVQVKLMGWAGNELMRQDLQVSEYGTFHGEFRLPENLPPGSYYLEVQDLDSTLSIPVAEYRKPEFQMNVAFEPTELLSGEALSARLDARYYFDAPVGDLAVSWNLYSEGSYFYLPGYSTGVYRPSSYWFSRYNPSEYLSSGDGRTNADGSLSIDLPAYEPYENLQKLVLEITGQDESGFPVSGRASVTIHPAPFYIGLRPDAWIGQAETPVGFEVLTVDWEREPVGGKTLQAEFRRVVWEQDANGKWAPTYTPIGSSNLATGADGKARLSFTPDAAGTYMLDVSGGGAHSQVLLWVGGTNAAVWPRSSENHIQLTADQDGYRAGDTARVFIPNPFPSRSLALVSVERGTVQQTQIIEMNGAGATFSLPLTDRHAPNVYVAATIIGPDNQFRQGIINLPVEPSAYTLNVALTAAPQRAGPGEPVTLDLRVTDQNNRPVQGEFSIAMADLAALALADPNSTDILSAFYSTQPLEIYTSVSLVGYQPLFAGGKGGGGGDGESLAIREEFPDTAYWNATLVTGADGRGQATVTLPDSLTTWRVDVRGVTADTRVGQTTLDVVSTKDLLIRPVTPRFLVAGDHLELAAVVNNNTGKEVTASVSLQASGFTLDASSEPTQRVQVPANGRARVAWWGTVETVESADLVFAAQAGSLQDASRPVWGALPILRYSSPRAFVTSGSLSEAGTRIELLGLPRSFDPTGGGLEVELSPSLAGSLVASLQCLQAPPADASVEWLLSYLLPNLEVYRTLTSAGLEDTALQALIETRLPETLQVLAERQNEDGGWGWYPGLKSDLYMTTYVLFGLARIRDAGQEVDEDMVQRAREYVIAARPYLGGGQIEGWKLDRLTYIEYVLSVNGGAEGTALQTLYARRDRLSPWAQALLALSIENAQFGDPYAADLLSGLQNSAVRAASGAYWETSDREWENPGTPLFTTAVVVFALAQRDPAAPALIDAVRYLASQRNAAGGWGSNYESAWVLMALTEAMRGSGELQADFAFSAAINNADLAAGQASAPLSLTPVTGSVPIDALDPEAPNKLAITRGEGSGRLYYRAVLTVYQPVETVQPLDKGLSITRDYLPYDCGKDCAPVTSVRLGDKLFTARLTLTVPHDSYYVVIDDYIPAGSEILNRQLKTSQQYAEGEEVQRYDEDDPLAKGWGWWWFNTARIYDDHIQWSAEYLPAGTYILTYTLIPTQAGEFRVLPAHAWLEYFPEVQGTGAGQVFAIKP